MKETYYLKGKWIYNCKLCISTRWCSDLSWFNKSKNSFRWWRNYRIETTGYLNCHYTRNIPTNKISIDDARKKLSSKVEITSEGLAIIPTEWKTEKFCYEFKGKVDDTDFIAYINAETGEEEDILIITNTPNGTLTE